MFIDWAMLREGPKRGDKSNPKFEIELLLVV